MHSIPFRALTWFDAVGVCEGLLGQGGLLWLGRDLIWKSHLQLASENLAREIN